MPSIFKNLNNISNFRFQRKKNDSLTQFTLQIRHHQLLPSPLIINISLMRDSIVYQVDCKEGCTDPHSTQSARRHSEIQGKRLKNLVDEFLSQDDYLWEDAIGVQHKLQQLEINIRKLRQETMQAIYNKKLGYALSWDKADDIEYCFRAARDGEWKKLTCANVFRVQEKINKGRKVVEKDVKILTRSIIEEAQRSVEIILKDCFASPNEGRYNREREDRREYRNREEERPLREDRERPERVPRPNQPKVQEPKFNNGFSTVKINKIGEIDTHFNVIVKVIKIHKEFRINNLKKTEFIGGDETGVAIVVLDSQDFIQPGAVISISNARIYSFHGIKQIQNSNKNSDIKLEKITINNINQRFNLSGKRDHQPREEKQQREDRPKRDERPPNRQPRERQPREQGGQKVEKRAPRENNDARPYRVRNNVSQQQEERPPRREKSDINNQSRRYQRAERGREEQRVPKVNRYDDKYEKYQINRKQDNNNNKMMSSQSDEDEQAAKKLHEQQKKESLEKDPKGNYTKISKIEPGDQNLTIFAQIYQLEIKGPQPQRGYFLSQIGDETGLVRIQLPKNNPAVKEGAVIKIVNVNVDVEARDHRITLKLSEDDGYVDKAVGMRIPKIELDVDMSELQWQSDDEEEQEQKKEVKKEAIIEDF